MKSLTDSSEIVSIQTPDKRDTYAMRNEAGSARFRS